MEGEANLPAPPPSSSRPQDFSRHVQAAFKRHRPLGLMASKNIRPRRAVVPQPETSSCSSISSGPTYDAKNAESVPLKNSTEWRKSILSIVGETQEDESSTAASASETIRTISEQSYNQIQMLINQPIPATVLKNATIFSHEEPQQQQVVDVQKKTNFLLPKRIDFQDTEWGESNQAETSTLVNHDGKQQKIELDTSSRCDGRIASSLEKNMPNVQDQLHHFGNFLSHPHTQSTIAGSSCTTTLVNSTSAPMITSTSSCSHSHQDFSSHVAGPVADTNGNGQPVSKRNVVQPSRLAPQSGNELSARVANSSKASASGMATYAGVKDNCLIEGQQESMSMHKENSILKDTLVGDKKSIAKGSGADVTDVQSQAPLSKNFTSDLKADSVKLEKQEKASTDKGASGSRKRNYNPDLFFKVNGKLYQKLGKIGSGGSSEVHKVISSDCHIYALKKIKLKGRDYATAYGFCQEILYLNKLKGKDNIIQLIDYEVTDRGLLREVMNGSITNKDAKVKDDGYIYMVLEYGEIDLATMLSQKWKEIDISGQTIDENWLRFYWQQILLAVNTIHEERIVHSDLKPANFLLVKGSLKLIDFGIAKAIMSDTTNIQRDSQVGTLSYMSPEAFMCNESDANGHAIKCGRPSDIWSLGCILYQMVYGRTPFSDYKTFWAKFKVITNPNHEIIYGPVKNPWLLDLMKKCLAWDRNQRWRIPQLLEHPFLVPQIPPSLPSSKDQSFKLLQLLSDACSNEEEASALCDGLKQLLRDIEIPVRSRLSVHRNDCKTFSLSFHES